MLTLAGDHTHSVDKAADGDLLRIIGPTGALALSIGIDPTGVHVVLEAATLNLYFEGTREGHDWS